MAHLMTLHDVRRDQFPALSTRVFLDAACASLAPRAAGDAIAAFLRGVQECPWRSATAYHIALDEARATARPEAARLIGASADEIALVENTSHALTVAARAIPLEAGDNILVPDLEYLQVPLAWRQLPPAVAPEIRIVRNVNGTLPVSQFEAAADNRTRAVVMSSVQWSNGYRADLGAMSVFCRERGILFVVDAIQQLGAFPIDVGCTPLGGRLRWTSWPAAGTSGSTHRLASGSSTCAGHRDRSWSRRWPATWP